MPILIGGRAALLNLARLISQVCGFERRIARRGRDSIDHGPGAHDDVADAAASVLLLCRKPKPQPVRTMRVNLVGR